MKPPSKPAGDDLLEPSKACEANESAASARGEIKRQKIDRWNSPVTGHGIAYMREMIVEFRTLQWINPHAAAAASARKKARDKATLLAQAREALKTPVASDMAGGTPALKKLSEEAESAANAAEEEAFLLERKQAVAEAAHIEAKNLAAAITARHEQGVATWIDMLEFESALVRLLDGEKLRVRYASLCAEYKGLAGIDAPPMPASEQALRAQAEALLAEIHWTYTTAPIQEKQRTRLTVCLLLVTAAVTILVAGFSPGRLLGWVAMAGALGAALSAFQRLQSRDMKADAMTNCEKDYDGRTWWRHPVDWFWNNVCSHNSFALAPVIGALSALVLAHLFAAGVIQGSAFPSISVETTNSVSRTTSENSHPTNSTAPTTTGTSPDRQGSAQPGQQRTETKQHVPSSFPTPNGTNKQEVAKATGGGEPVVKLAECDHCWEKFDCKKVALLLVWAFLAGFSERLVPDILTRFTQKAKT